MGSERLQTDLTTESGIARIIHSAERADWEKTFSLSPGKIDSQTLIGNADAVADWRIEELVEEHGSLMGALEKDPILREQLTAFERGRRFIEFLTQD